MDKPFLVVPFRALDNAVHQACISEQCYCEFSIKSTVNAAAKDLVNEVIYYAV